MVIQHVTKPRVPAGITWTALPPDEVSEWIEVVRENLEIVVDAIAKGEVV